MSRLVRNDQRIGIRGTWPGCRGCDQVYYHADDCLLDKERHPIVRPPWGVKHDGSLSWAEHSDCTAHGVRVSYK